MRRRIEFDVWKGGHPVWCVLRIDGKEVAQLHHSELTDLEHEVRRAMRDARNELPQQYKSEV